MYSKLTLNLQEDVIRKAKNFAKDNRISLSKIVEKYLDSLATKGMARKPKLPPLTGELSGLLKGSRGRLDISDYRHQRLREKYL